MNSNYVEIDGINTHYIESGTGPDVVLFHGGDFGGRAENSWGDNIDALAERYHVVAPDWLGFGRTDKVYDFVNGKKRLISHMASFLEHMNLQRAHYVGNSMGATILLSVVANGDTRFDPQSIVIASGGGFVPDNEHRRALLEYDCTTEGMVKMLKAIFSDPKWWTDDTYVKLRHGWTIEPGVWEACAASRFKAPHIPPRPTYGQPDNIPYENIKIPTLLIAGDEDKLKEPNYIAGLAQRIPHAEQYVFQGCGHCPNIERAAVFNDLVLDFLDRMSE